MKIIDILSESILEGGNVFKNQNKEIETTSIKQSDILLTLKWLEKIVNIPLIDNTLGSVGKKSTSGDIDIAIDSNLITKDELIARLSKWVIKNKRLPKDWIRKSGISVHFKTPIKGNVKNGLVQTDFMFHLDPNWMKFSMYSAGDTSKFTGAERNLLMSSIAKIKGLKYSWQKGLINRESETLISKDPNTIATILLGPNFTSDDLTSVERIKSAAKLDPIVMNGVSDLISKLSDHTGKNKTQIVADNEEIERLKKIFS